MPLSSPNRKERPVKKRFDLPYLGFGLGLRPPHYQQLLEPRSDVDWLEIISENFLLDGGRAHYFLDQFMERYTLIPHGVSMSVGNAEDLNPDYLKKLKKLIARIDPPWFSDHICWAGHEGQHMHNLLPLPYTTEVADYVAEKIRMVQDMMERPFLLENVSSYVEFTQSDMPEWEFLSHVAEKADCGLLLDVNNVFVSSRNHHFDPMTFIRSLPADRVIQYHIAGHLDKGRYILDTHGQSVRDEVWQLFEQTAPLFGDVSLIIERDEDIPPLEDVLEELAYARKIYRKSQPADAA